MIENNLKIERILINALKEDIGFGDLTTDSLIPAGSIGEAHLIAKEELVLAGIEVFGKVFQLLSNDIELVYHYKDSQIVPINQEICIVSGPTEAILKGERTALNLLQRMSGIATLTKKYIDAIGSKEVRIVDTRKTVPGLRILDKYSVRMGGGYNHRLGLSDGILIKDNHIASVGSIKKSISLARNNVPHTLKIEIEVENLSDLENAIQSGADIILLDNMSPEMMHKSVRQNNGRAILEASGNINLDNIKEGAETGVDIISIGALTHSPRAVDLSLKIAS